eukprot:jgi/Psemu1/19725/gm1.19725_g
MPEPAISWNEVRKLNAAFAQTLPNIASLFIIDKDGVKTLRPDPIPVLKSLIIAAIMDELPASKVFKEHKQRIALLLSNSAIYWHMKDLGRLRVQDKCALDKAARRANNGNPIIRLLVMTIFSWKFHKDWYPYEFHKVYNPGYGIPLDGAMLQRKTPFHTQITNELKFNGKLIEQSKRELNGEMIQQVLSPRRKHRSKRPNTTRPATSSLTPVKAIESEVKPIIQVPAQCTSEFPNSTSTSSKSTPTPRAGAPPVTANLGLIQPVSPIADTPTVKPPSYTWTWKYSPNSDSVSFRRVRSNSISFRRATSSSPPNRHQDKSIVTPVQRQDKSTVTALPVTSSTLPSSDRHPAPPWVLANFRWTFNPQSETLTFHRLPKPAPIPLESPSCFPLADAIAYDPVSCPIQSKHTEPPVALQTTSSCPEDKDVSLLPLQRLILCQAMLNQAHAPLQSGYPLFPLYLSNSMRYILAPLLGILSSILTGAIHSGSGDGHFLPSFPTNSDAVQSAPTIRFDYLQSLLQIFYLPSPLALYDQHFVTYVPYYDTGPLAFILPTTLFDPSGHSLIMHIQLLTVLQSYKHLQVPQLGSHSQYLTEPPGFHQPTLQRYKSVTTTSIDLSSIDARLNIQQVFFPIMGYINLRLIPIPTTVCNDQSIVFK